MAWMCTASGVELGEALRVEIKLTRMLRRFAVGVEIGLQQRRRLRRACRAAPPRHSLAPPCSVARHSRRTGLSASLEALIPARLHLAPLSAPMIGWMWVSITTAHQFAANNNTGLPCYDLLPPKQDILRLVDARGKIVRAALIRVDFHHQLAVRGADLILARLLF